MGDGVECAQNIEALTTGWRLSKRPPPMAVALEPLRLEGVLLLYLVNRTTFLALPRLAFPAFPAMGHTFGSSPHPVQPC